MYTQHTSIISDSYFFGVIYISINKIIYLFNAVKGELISYNFFSTIELLELLCLME